jgi:hypothetical protein
LDSTTFLPLPARRHCGFVGTPKYASLNAHSGEEIGRRDDLYSWFYSIIEMLKGELPWNGIIGREAIKTAKMADGVLEEMCEGLPVQIPAIWRCLERYGHSDVPDYDLLMAFLVEAMKDGQCKFEDKFDWEVRLDAIELSRISVIPLIIPADEKPTIPKRLPPAIVPGEEIVKSKKCCSVQ